MKTTFISTHTLHNAPRAALPRLQEALAKANVELTTGRRADVGLDLGVGTGETIALRIEQTRLKALADGNAIASAQLDRTQAALDDITSGANEFMEKLVGIQAADGAATVLRQHARTGLAALTATLNTSDGRRYLFGGQASGTKPMSDYAGGPKASIDAAFAARFGLDPADPQSDPAVAAISPADMRDFLATEFAAAFDDAAWSANWSQASDTARTSLIAPSETVETSVSANETAMRKLAMAFTMVGELGTTKLSAATLQSVLDSARSMTGAAISELSGISGRLGTAQHRIDAANTLMQAAGDVSSTRLSVLEAVDPAEAKTRLDTITTQIEMSYALTSRMLKLSIMNYV
ncbi:flagellar hook-associated family protein [Aquabacter spiritensis]|uniref:Flagellin n=1 Tax=Aquabacter spiritensis TaxID=933073 RepID=A0A4R3M8G7_9HYPH|nr:flagellar hook-associated family protein [Aquabacter spiritensis]TCT07947.1 flagellar hook-associated protein 3 FlgL [Aquabacter spiritensis]